MSAPALVATLVADPKTLRLSDALISRAAQGAPGFAGWRWLDEGVAADLFFNAPAAPVRAAVEAALRGEAADVVVQAASGRAKRLVVADMDSTLIGQECLDKLAERFGVGAHVAAITARAMRGEIAFAPALREPVALLKGLPESAVAVVLATRIAVSPGARMPFRTLRARGAHVAVVSSGFKPFTSAVAAWLGADEARGNELVARDGALTGEMVEPILGPNAKLAALRELAAKRGLALRETMAIRDGANDLAMLAAAGLGVAYRAKPRVAAAAAARVDHADLTALRYAQGVPRSAFVED